MSKMRSAATLDAADDRDSGIDTAKEPSPRGARPCLIIEPPGVTAEEAANVFELRNELQGIMARACTDVCAAILRHGEPRRSNVRRLYLMSLTVEEKKVFELILLCKCNKEIASEMNLSIRTVKFHISKVLVKFGVRTRFELFRIFGPSQ